MINLIVNLLISVLNLFGQITFGVLDNIAFVYGVLLFVTFFSLLYLNKYFKIFEIFNMSSKLNQSLLLIGVFLNTMPDWKLWFLGLIILAVFFVNNKDKKSVKSKTINSIRDFLNKLDEEPDDEKPRDKLPEVPKF